MKSMASTAESLCKPNLVNKSLRTIQMRTFVPEYLRAERCEAWFATYDSTRVVGPKRTIMHASDQAVQDQPPPPPHKNDAEFAITNTSLFLDYNSPHLYRCLNHDARRLLI